MPAAYCTWPRAFLSLIKMMDCKEKNTNNPMVMSSLVGGARVPNRFFEISFQIIFHQVILFTMYWCQLVNEGLSSVHIGLIVADVL